MPADLPSIWLLAGIRLIAIFVVSPFFGNRLIPRVALFPLAGVMGLFGAAVAPSLGLTSQSAVSVGFGELIFEIFVGVSLGLAARLLFSVFEVVGELTSWIVAPAIGRSPAFSDQQNIPAIFISLLGTCFFFLVGGHHALIGAFVSTLGCVPLGGQGVLPSSALGLGDQLAFVFGVVLSWSVLLVLPLFFVAVALELAGGIFVSFGRVGFGPTIPVIRTLAAQVALAAVWYSVVRIAVSHLLVFVAEHPLCGMLGPK